MAIRMTPAPERGSARWIFAVVLSIGGILAPVFIWSLLADWLAGSTRPVDVLAKIGYILSALMVLMYAARVILSFIGSRG